MNNKKQPTPKIVYEPTGETTYKSSNEPEIKQTVETVIEKQEEHSTTTHQPTNPEPITNAQNNQPELPFSQTSQQTTQTEPEKKLEVEEKIPLEAYQMVAAISASHPHAISMPEPNLVQRVLSSVNKKLRAVQGFSEKEFLRTYASKYFTKRGLPELVARKMADSFTIKYDDNLTDEKLNVMINLYEDLLKQLQAAGSRIIKVEPGTDFQKPFTVKVNFKYTH
ncbi:hypothetical protein HZA97_05120 [Candidatus Woesearchaeota archaeon]|nr:hypothetical protein [Candidatus Woesearchaeota archaeon]